MYRNKVFASFQFKSRDVPQALLSETPYDPTEVPVMRRKKWPLLVILLIILLIAVCTLPWVTRIELTMEGAEVSPDGTVISSGEFTLHGRIYDYLFQDTIFKLDALHIPNLEIGGIIEQTFPIMEYPDLFLTNVWVELPEYTSNYNLYIGTLLFPEDRSFWVLEVTGRIFIGSVHVDASYAAIIEQCGPLLERSIFQ